MKVKILNRNIINSKNTLSIKILVATMSFIILYWRDLFLIINEALNNESSSHIIAVPFLLGYIIYRNRRRIHASMTHPYESITSFNHNKYNRISGAILCFLGYIMMWYGSYTFYTLEIHIISLPIFVSGITLIIFNYHTLKATIFPIIFLLFLVPLPVTMLQTAVSFLSFYDS